MVNVFISRLSLERFLGRLSAFIPRYEHFFILWLISSHPRVKDFFILPFVNINPELQVFFFQKNIKFIFTLRFDTIHPEV